MKENKQIIFRASEELYKEIAQTALDMMIPRKTLIKLAIDEWLKKHKGEK